VGMCECEQMCITYTYIREKYNTILHCIIVFSYVLFYVRSVSAIHYIAETRSCFTATCFDCLDCVSASFFSYM